ncbi:unannotated protein [freshwater metagenome]|uniref:Unannotated protein n=1 Tax=freshwater metagenome TaxID=449393 RepID=A0A6J6GKF4_9ZZZZ
MRTTSCAPHASASRHEASAAGGPTVTTVQVSFNASATAKPVSRAAWSANEIPANRSSPSRLGRTHLMHTEMVMFEDQVRWKTMP